MYGYSEFIPLNEEEILKRVSQEEIIEMALGYKPVPYQRITSPLKKNDTKPGAWFEWYNGKLFFQDFGDNPTHRICFKFIADFYNVSFRDALKLVNTHFQLGLGSSDEMEKPKPVIFHNPHQNQVQHASKQRTHIIYHPRPFNLQDKKFWFDRYKIGKQQLIDDEVTALIWYKFYSMTHNKWVIIRPSDVAYCYTEFKEHVKVYRPFSPDKRGKWLSNCDENDIGGLSLLPPTGSVLTISKAYKDYRVLKNQGLSSTIWFQNEGCVPTEEIIRDLCSRFPRIYIFFDNDEGGIKNALKLAEIFNSFSPGIASPIWLPEILLQSHITDPSDLIWKRSQTELKHFLVEKDFYGNNSSNHSRLMAQTP